MEIHVYMPRRRAVVDVNKWWANKLGVQKGPMPCHVLGLFQCVENEESAYPVFVCELDDGRIMEVYVTAVRFTDTEGGILHD